MASERYNAPAREKHWQKVWEDAGIFTAANDADWTGGAHAFRQLQRLTKHYC